MTKMTEASMYKQLKPNLETYGTVTRLESSVTGGVPDVMWLTRHGILLLELKVAHGNYINLQSWQVAFHSKAMIYNTRATWFVVRRKVGVSRLITRFITEVYSWLTLSELTRGVTSKGVKISLEGIIPYCMLDDEKDVDRFLKSVYRRGYASHIE